MCIRDRIISDPSSIDYLINYQNQPGERMYVLLLTANGNHTLFLNRLFYLDHELDLNIVWYSDTDDYVGILASYLQDANCIGIDKFWSAQFLLPLMNQTNDETCFELGSICVDYIRMTVSYTHLDVYKRQETNNNTIKNMFL